MLSSLKAFVLTCLLSSAAFAIPQTPSAVATPSGGAVPTGTACNNSPELCNRAYNNITYLGAHDSAFVSSAGTGVAIATNQYFDSPTQLSAGVRLLSVQVHRDDGAWKLCHTSCALFDAGTLGSWLSGVKKWLDANPNEVITILIVNSDNAAPADIAGEMNSAQITNYAYTPSSTGTWPTLSTMIASGKRLVLFAASIKPDPQYPYILNEWNYIFENPYNNTNTNDFSCNADRPSTDTTGLLAQGRMPLQNHFLYSDLGNILGNNVQAPDTSALGTTNAPASNPNGTHVGSLAQSASNCTSYWNRAPSYILVDFFNVGPAIGTVDSLNGVTNPTGRKAVSAANPPDDEATNLTSALSSNKMGVIISAIVASHLW